MLEQCRRYLDYQGVHYCKPEKAGALAGDMIALKNVAQAARKEFQTLSLVLAEHVSPFVPERVSQWMNQAQICRPHFWTYYRFPSASLTDSALAIRLYGKGTEAGISVEVSFIERKKVETSLLQQNRVLNCSIAHRFIIGCKRDRYFIAWTERRRIDRAYYKPLKQDGFVKYWSSMMYRLEPLPPRRNCWNA